MRRGPARIAALVLALSAALAGAGCGDDEGAGAAGSPPDRGRMVLATTTSTRDSGLLDELLPTFEKTSGCSVKTLAVGSGEAMELGARGDADVLLIHSPDAEQDFMSEGHGASRKAVMHNDFVIVGPADDPAHVSKAADAPDAFAGVADAEDNFASRADESGTNAKELELWDTAGIQPKGSWYIETGQGMGETLTIADQKEAYTLSDRGTFLATDNLDSRLLLEGGKDLLNPYHVIVVAGEDLNTACAKRFSSWLTSPRTQKTIADFGVAEYGEPLFFPDAQG